MRIERLKVDIEHREAHIKNLEAKGGREPVIAHLTMGLERRKQLLVEPEMPQARSSDD